jgi:DNA-binding Lrp family transcriptional regulator
MLLNHKFDILLTRYNVVEKAYVMINCEMGAEAQIAEAVRSIDYTKEVLSVFGNYDVVMKLECPTIEELTQIIATKIRKLDKVRSTTTLMCAN